MSSDWDDYTLHIKLRKHYQSIIGVSTLRFEVAYHISVLAGVHDSTNRETCRSGLQSYGIPSGHTPRQELLQHTGIP